MLSQENAILKVFNQYYYLIYKQCTPVKIAPHQGSPRTCSCSKAICTMPLGHHEPRPILAREGSPMALRVSRNSDGEGTGGASGKKLMGVVPALVAWCIIILTETVYVFTHIY